MASERVWRYLSTRLREDAFHSGLLVRLGSCMVQSHKQSNTLKLEALEL